jgi:hypothetical protein
MPKKITTAQFIVKAQVVHGVGTYGYDAVDYQCAVGKVIIACYIHGPFLQTPNSHLNGSGCASCGRQRLSAFRNKGKQEFIKQAQARHGDAYSYEKVEYFGGHSNVIIICPEHGPFLQLPTNHLKGCGCAKCGVTRTVASKFKGFDWFVFMARKTHGERYGYRIESYTGVSKKTTIVCQQHGKFLQSPSNHIRGQGCPKCAMGKEYKPGAAGQIHVRPASRSGWISRQRGRNATLYLIELQNEQEVFFKVGITYDFKKRFAGARMPYALQIVKSYQSADAGSVYDLEKKMHRTLKNHRYRPAVAFGGQTECFSSVDEILATFPL